LRPEVAVHPQPAHGRLEESARRLRISSFADLPQAPARVVELAAAGLADAMEDALGAQGKGSAQPLGEDLRHRSREAEEDEARAPRACRVRGLEDAGDVLVGEARDDGRDVDADVQPGPGQTGHRFHPPLRRCDEGLESARVLLAPDGDADGHADAGGPLQLAKEIEVALHQRRFADDAHRIAIFGAGFEAAAGQPIGSLQWLIAIGDAGKDDQLALPRRALEGLTQEPRRLRLDGDLPLEIGAGAEAEIFVRRARVAIGAAMKAAAVGIDAPGESEVGAVVVREVLAGVVLVDLQLRLWDLL